MYSCSDTNTDPIFSTEDKRTSVINWHKNEHGKGHGTVDNCKKISFTIGLQFVKALNQINISDLHNFLKRFDNSSCN